MSAGVDPVQRLQRDLERAVPRAGAQVPRVQFVQHPGDEGCVPQDLRRTRGHVTKCQGDAVQRLVEIICLQDVAALKVKG